MLNRGFMKSEVREATKHFKLGTVFFLFFYTWCMDGCLSQGWGHRRNSWELFWCNSLQFKVKGWTTFLNTAITVVSNAMPVEGSKVRFSWGFLFWPLHSADSRSILTTLRILPLHPVLIHQPDWPRKFLECSLECLVCLVCLVCFTCWKDLHSRNAAAAAFF